MMMQGKKVIITGAASGIGLAAVRKFAEAGARVFGLDRKPDIASIGDDILNVTGICCDLTDISQIKTALDGFLDDGNVDVLVNNAGINPSPSSLTDTSETLWQRLLDTNLTAIYRLTKAVMTHMQCGSIINISSILALSGANRNAAYAATKGAIISLTRAMARDHGPAIRVNCVCPGAVETEMFEEYLSRCEDPVRERKRICETLPLQRLGKPEDIAEAVFFLTSGSASWITGQVLVVDGGDSA
ncbi:SDR family oxidoreductase [Prosthecochloris sp. SCSIO W1102]|uniref:SDR family NAD(P)-dependent oxidoreductase n=1 Tax=Prosthecochloris sp. SCSIO W1102 TaxID=2992243 RepID=UPI00223E8C5A|nr:SDR family oxidoreductase [Prosthecochloris sp. SCSIO W1102]UZJ39779.1 SDR family oxidoreductase [Prosthecochloris sp. SCSIO W1102]